MKNNAKLRKQRKTTKKQNTQKRLKVINGIKKTRNQTKNSQKQEKVTGDNKNNQQQHNVNYEKQKSRNKKH